MVAEDQHLRGELDLRRARGDIPEGRERIPVGAAALLRNLFRYGDVLTAREVVEAEPVGGLGDLRKLGDPGRGLPWGVRAEHGGDDRACDSNAHGRVSTA
nr:hypothetical protein [Nocardioides sp. B-3]